MDPAPLPADTRQRAGTGHRRCATSEKDTAAEFLVVAIPDGAAPGGNLRLLGVEPTRAAAEKVVMEMGAGTLGRVAILERSALFDRRPAVESVPVDEPIVR